MEAAPVKPGRLRITFAMLVTIFLWATVRPPLLIARLFCWSFGLLMDSLEWVEIKCTSFTGWLSGVPNYLDAIARRRKAERREKMLAELSADSES